MIHSTLKKLRTDAGHKQSYLAHKLGVTQGHISELENGKIYPTLGVLEMYATYFGKESIEQVIINHLQV